MVWTLYKWSAGLALALWIVPEGFTVISFEGMKLLQQTWFLPLNVLGYYWPPLAQELGWICDSCLVIASLVRGLLALLLPAEVATTSAASAAKAPVHPRGSPFLVRSAE